jgi:hypothetical protein
MKSLLYDKFDIITAIFEKSKEEAYKKIYTDEVLVSNASGYRLDKDALQKCQSEYMRLTFLLCGEEILDDLVTLHGDLENVCANVSIEFINRVLDDQAVLSTREDVDEIDELEQYAMEGR